MPVFPFVLCCILSVTCHSSRLTTLRLAQSGLLVHRPGWKERARSLPGDRALAVWASASLGRIVAVGANADVLVSLGKHLTIQSTEAQCAELEYLIHAGNAPARKQTRARMLLLSDRSRGQKRTDQEVADAVLCSTSTVRNIHRRFVAGGLPSALNDKGWPGATPGSPVSLDETGKELHSTPRGTLPMEPDWPQCQDYECERLGVCNLFLAIELLRGRRKARLTDWRTALDFAGQLRVMVDEDDPDADAVVLVLDNLNIHGPTCLDERFEPATARRIAAKPEWHCTPEHASWLNIAECELSVLSSQCLKQRIRDKESLIREAAAWELRRYAMHVGVDWQFTKADARAKLRRLYRFLKEHTAT